MLFYHVTLPVTQQEVALTFLLLEFGRSLDGLDEQNIVTVTFNDFWGYIIKDDVASTLLTETSTIKALGHPVSPTAQRPP